ncbi:MAG: alpha-galactosidase [Opitutales bacterium]|nr:alpha-galactosidase [Opitutales bacterium]
MKKIYLIGAVLTFVSTLFAENFTTKFDKIENEKWWGGYNAIGRQMPFGAEEKRFDLASGTWGNLAVPFFVSNKGRFVYSQKPFKIAFQKDCIEIESEFEKVEVQKSGETLKSAYLAAAKKYFARPNAKLPNELFFSMPQYNTWIELMYNQNERDILLYAQNLEKYGFPKGVFMIDDKWMKEYGNYDFDPKKFSDPKAMISTLHKKGFKVMLWVVPYVDLNISEFADLSQKNMLVLSKYSQKPLHITWWNGKSAAYDLTNPATRQYLLSTLENMRKTYGVDGFKFDGGEHLYTPEAVFCDKSARGWDYLKEYVNIGAQFPFNEFRSSWNSPNAPIVQRLADKFYGWADLQALIPDMVATGLMGSAYACPDMIGGGEYRSFLNKKKGDIDEKIIVRSCQVHALMPMMQFSVAPWRILSEENLNICVKFAHLHKQFAPYILELARHSSKTGEPIIRAMEYEFPGEGFENVKDQFMLGGKYLVAPVVNADNFRAVKLPKGKWLDDLGKTHEGGREIKIDAPLERLPYFKKL